MVPFFTQNNCSSNARRMILNRSINQKSHRELHLRNNSLPLITLGEKLRIEALKSLSFHHRGLLHHAPVKRRDEEKENEKGKRRKTRDGVTSRGKRLEVNFPGWKVKTAPMKTSFPFRRNC